MTDPANLMGSILSAHFPGMGVVPAPAPDVAGVPSASGVLSRSMPFAEYLRVEGVNWSSLKHMAKSPKHYQYEKVPPPDETAAMVKGRAAHTAVLEPAQFDLEYVVYPGRRAGKEWDNFEAANLDRTILTKSEEKAALAIRDAVHGHKVASALLSYGRPEQVIEWNDAETGIHCKGRIDFLRRDALVDLKTTANLDPRRFSVTALDMAYHGQLAFYLRGLAALGLDDLATYIVAVEADQPHDVAALKVDPGALAMGDVLVSALLNRLAECEATKEWPGRYPEEATFFLPGWAYVEDAGEPATFGLTVAQEA